MDTTLKPQTQPTIRRSPGLRAALGIARPDGWCDVNGCAIAWKELQGRATEPQPKQTILCLHAAGSGSREFRPLLDRVPDGTRLIFMDWPGHGRSGEIPPATGQTLTVECAASIIHSLLTRLGIHLPILLGSGFGAAAAIRFAADCPDKSLGLVLCQPAGLIASVSAGSSSKGKRAFRSFLRRIEKFAPGKAGSDAVLATKRQALRMEVLKPVMQPAVSAVRKSLEQSGATLRSALESLTVPALFALSHDSPESPLSRYIAVLEPSMAWAPRHQFTVFEGAFNPIWDEPQRFAQMLTSFVQARLPVEKHTHAWLISAVDWPTKNNNLWKCVHPECDAERVIPAGQNANQDPTIQVPDSVV